ncbi:MAG: GIY-YIG nuclease family protein, partial [Ktedonobacteraceae bacterium]
TEVFFAVSVSSPCRSSLRPEGKGEEPGGRLQGMTDGDGRKREKRQKQMKHYYVSILANHSKTLYTGVTNNLQRRLYEHKHHLVVGFTSK